MGKVKETVAALQKAVHRHDDESDQQAKDLQFLKALGLTLVQVVGITLTWNATRSS